jgi:hypothetical protein
MGQEGCESIGPTIQHPERTVATMDGIAFCRRVGVLIPK